MKYTKPATSIDEQIILLRERGMTGCEDLMRLWLTTVGYYRLRAYWLPFEILAQEGQAPLEQFQAGTGFAQIVDSYVFDRKLRLMTMEAIERIEIALRSRWTNHITLKYGSHAQLKPSTSGRSIFAYYHEWQKTARPAKKFSWSITRGNMPTRHYLPFG